MLESLFNKVAETLFNNVAETPKQEFSSEYYKIFKNTFFEEHLQTSASGIC